MRTLFIVACLLVCGASAALAQDVCAPAKVTTLSQTLTGFHTYAIGWTATGDDCSTGDASTYEVYRSTSTITDTNWQSATLVGGDTSASNGNTNCYVAPYQSCPATTYYYAVFLIDDAGNRSPISNVISAAPRCGAPNTEVIDCP
jgi:hypothetical protein